MIITFPNKLDSAIAGGSYAEGTSPTSPTSPNHLHHLITYITHITHITCITYIALVEKGWEGLEVRSGRTRFTCDLEVAEGVI